MFKRDLSIQYFLIKDLLISIGSMIFNVISVFNSSSTPQSSFTSFHFRIQVGATSTKVWACRTQEIALLLRKMKNCTGIIH